MSYTMDRVRRYLKCSPSALSVTHSGESPITQPNSVITTVYTPQTLQSLEIQVSRDFFTVRVMRYWQRLPREVMEALSLEKFRVRLGEL